MAVEAIREVAEAHGCSVEVGHGGKHTTVVVRAPDGRWAKTSVSGSPRADDKAVVNWSRQDTRRIIREFGLSTD